MVSGLNPLMSEGDVSCVFSQYGEIVDIKLLKFKNEKNEIVNKGIGFICYEDQRSTILAVDNFNGITLCDYKILVDHISEYKLPKNNFNKSNKITDLEKEIYKPSGPDGLGWGEYRNSEIKDIYEVNKNNNISFENNLL